MHAVTELYGKRKDAVNSHVIFLLIIYGLHIISAKEMMTLPNIKPISDLRNYTEVLKEVKTNQPVYLTRNGRGHTPLWILMSWID